MHTFVALATALACAGMCAGAFAQVPVVPGQAGVPAALQPLVVPLTVNGTVREPALVLLGAGEIWIALADLESAGLIPGKVAASMTRQLRGVSRVSLRDMGSLLTYRFNEALLTLDIQLQADAMALNSVNAGAAADPASATPRTASAYVNYSVTGLQGTSPSLFLEAVASLRGHTLQAYLTRDSQGRAFRGPVSLMLNDEASRRQLVIGDALWAGTGLLGSVPVGGLVLQSYFGFEPAFITTPTLDLRGYAPTPSTVDVLVNGTLVGQRQIPAGPFQLGNIVAQAGSNDVTAVVRDAFGRETRFGGGTFYGSAALLKQGLTSYSLAMGRVREDRAGQGPAYRDPVVLAQAAHGLDKNVTGGIAAQSSRQFNAFAAQLAATSDRGEFGAQVARSNSASGHGMALLLSYRLSTPAWGIGASLTRRQRAFADLAAPLLLPDRALRQDEISVGRRLLGIDWGLRLSATGDAQNQLTRRVTLAASRRFGERLTTILEFGRSSGATSDTSVFLLASYSLDPARTVSMASTWASGRRSTTLDVAQVPQEALSTGYRLANTWSAGGNRPFAEVTRDTTFGDYQLQAAHSLGSTQLSWRASGAVVAIDGGAFAAPPIRDAFALVRVPGAPQVPVRVEGRYAGRTDEQGSLVVPDLSSYSRQRVAIDTQALPLDYEVGEVERRVNPPLRGGEVVQFDVQIYRAVTGRIVDARGAPVASGVIVLGDGRRIATGTQGDFVVDGDRPRGQARVERPGQPAGACRITFPAVADPIVAVLRLGELRCMP